MQVKTKKAHHNGHGSSFAKKRGQVYEHPNPAADIKAGFVKEVKSNDVQSASDRVSGNGAKSIPAKKHNSKIDSKALDESGAGTNQGKSKA